MKYFDKAAAYRVVPVIAIDDVKQALPLADALIEGGLPIAEVTFRTEAAAEVMRVIARERPEIILGAGTILKPEQIAVAQACGAVFGVAPGLNPRVLTEAQRLGFEFVPGVANPSDVELGLELGCRVLKLFPAEVVGGVKMISALSAAYGHTGVKFMPTGGVTPANLLDYLKLRTVAAAGGTWIAKKEDMAAGNWSQIVANCRAVVEQVKGL